MRGNAMEQELVFQQELAANAVVHNLWSCMQTACYACGVPSPAFAAQLGMAPGEEQPVFVQIMPYATHGSLRSVLHDPAG